MEFESNFRRMARKLIKNKIYFTTSDVEPHFEIQGERFTRKELMRLGHRKKLSNSGLREIIRTKRVKSTI